MHIKSQDGLSIVDYDTGSFKTEGPNIYYVSGFNKILIGKYFDCEDSSIKVKKVLNLILAAYDSKKEIFEMPDDV